MKKILTLTLVFLLLTACGQDANQLQPQQMTLEKWNEEAKTNIRFLPKYGHIKKSEEQSEADQKLIQALLKPGVSKREASNNLINLGFGYLYNDIRIAMYRFNQAYLLDSTNTDIYWGYGAVYMTLGDYTKAVQQYQEGLAIDSTNTHLLTDYATYFMVQASLLQPVNQANALSNLESAIASLLKSYRLDPINQNTTFKLSVCYWNKDDCVNAWKYYKICKTYGGQPITEGYTNELKKKCEQQK